MTICEDAPCCGCCGRDLYGNDAWAQPEPDYDPDMYLSYDQSCATCEGDEDYAIEEFGGPCPDCNSGGCLDDYIMEDQWLDGSWEE